MTAKDIKRNRIIDGACALFLEKSMPTVTLKEIAVRSGVGEATVYRYFSNRSELIVACAVRLQKEVERQFSELCSAATGYEKLVRFYRVYLDLFLKDPELYRVLNEFDAYCVNEGALDLESYADNMDRFKNLFDSAYAQGVSDGTVNPRSDIDLFYYTTTHAVLSLCKKLAVGKRITRQDELTDGAAEIKTLTEIVVSSLKSC